jgi:exosortase/archaeosortase family protein
MAPANKRKYTTKKITEMTRQQLQEQEAVSKARLRAATALAPVDQPMVEPPPDHVMEPPKPSQFASASESIQAIEPEQLQPVVSSDPKPSVKLRLPKHVPQWLSSFVIFILSFTVFYNVFTVRIPGGWAAQVSDVVNNWIAYTGYAILGALQTPCEINGSTLLVHNASISLQGDTTSVHSALVLLPFAMLWAAVQKVTAIRKGIIFLSFIPCIFFSNVLRIVLTAGILLSYGPETAQLYFHDLLKMQVYVVAAVGLMLIAALFNSDEETVLET